MSTVKCVDYEYQTILNINQIEYRQQSQFNIMVKNCFFSGKLEYNLYNNKEFPYEAKPFLFLCANDTVEWTGGLLGYRDIRSISGNGTITFSKTSFCMKFLNIYKATGKFVHGILNGNARITFSNKEIMIAKFRTGVLNGISRKFRCEFGSCGIFEDPNLNQPTKLGEVTKILIL